MTDSDITYFLGENWHKNGEKTRYLNSFKDQMKNDTNADFYKDTNTKEVILITNKNKNEIHTDDYFK